MASKELDITDILLSDEQAAVAQEIEETDAHFFVTGKAGTGKSVLLQFIKGATTKKHVVLAPTGVAALNVGGQTLHSFFRLPPTFLSTGNIRVEASIVPILKKLEMIVIDEISMVRADVMDAIDYILRKARKNSAPFGGVQMVLFGDVYQLPPVVSDPSLIQYFVENHGGFYFFNASVWNTYGLEVRELSTIFRQTEEEFKRILNDIRTGEVTQTDLDALNATTSENVPTHGVVTLASTNRVVDTINSSRLRELTGPEFVYKAKITGKFEEGIYPTDESLRLKRGAQVMFLKNDKEKRWVNGTIGIVESLTDKEVQVNVDGKSLTVPKETWEKVKYTFGEEEISTEVVSSFSQIPLRLAWAITIHKSQGQQYDSVVIDLGAGSFAHGQSYVAISRCRTLDGLFLKRHIRMSDIIVDPLVVGFMGRVS